MANQVAWVGADGNLWWRQGDQVINAGSANQYEFTNGGLRAVNFDTPLGQGAGFAPGVDQIADPNAPQQAPASGGGSGVSRPVLDNAAINNTQATINQIPALLQAALEAEGVRFTNTVNSLNAQETSQRGTYDNSTVTNQQNYDSNFMDSIRAGIKGLGGLFTLLRGTGASGGTAEDMARDTVGGVTAQDIRTGADTQKENQTALDSALSTFLTNLKEKRTVNEDTKTNNERAIRRDSNTQLQDLFGKMAGYYGAAEQTGNRDWWMNKAGELTPSIAADSKTQVSAYDTTPIAVQAPQLTAFSGPTQPSVMTGDSAERGRVGSGIFTISDQRRRKEQAPVGV